MKSQHQYILNLTKANNALKLKVQQLEDQMKEPIEELEIVKVPQHQQKSLGGAGKHRTVFFNKENIVPQEVEKGHQRNQRNFEKRPQDEFQESGKRFEGQPQRSAGRGRREPLKQEQ